jgi:spore coat polysaccharide biosynthesis protein SpsF
MRKAIFVTVRTGSSRLPNKSILKIQNRHTIEYVINSVKKSKFADEIILCTTDLKQDEILCDIARKNKISFFQGDEHNKSKRWYEACKKFNIDFFVTADGDDLFYDVGLSDLCFKQIKDNDFINGQGLYNDVYGIKTTALETILNILNDKNVEPHDMVDFLKDKSLRVKKLTDVPEIYKKRDIRMTLDYEDDFKFFSKVIENIKLDFNIENVLYYLDKNPEVKNINYYLEEKWKENQNK